MTTVATSPAAGAREKRIPGEQGTWVFLFGDMIVFAVFFATFLVERSHAPDAFDAARRTLHTGVGITNTLVLLTSSMMVYIALSAVRAGARSLAVRVLAAAIVCGLTFLALKVFEYSSLVAAGHGPGAHKFYLYYFILTGLHLLHVIVGICVLTFLVTQARRAELSATRMAIVEGGACFWHLVDLLWVVLFPLLYLVS